MISQLNGVNGRQTGARHSDDPFNGFFSHEQKASFAKDDLLDARARRVFDLTARACEAGVYPYQIPLEGRSGPWVVADGRELLLLSSYDYLGLLGDPRVDEGAINAIRKYGAGTGGARMLTGTTDLHLELEAELAAFKGTDTALTFSSGYAANLAAVSALLAPQDRVILDSFSHRSLVDACRLAGVSLQRFRHNDVESLRQELRSGAPANRTLIVVDGVYSMDGDICRLPEIIDVKKEFGCFLMVDDSHALGVIGATGRGTDEYFDVPLKDIDLWTGSMAKAIPSTGGYIATSEELGIFLQHAASPYVFSAALCPPAAGAALAGLKILRTQPERLDCLKRSSDFLRDGLRSLGYDVGLSETPIIPIILGDDPAAAFLAKRLRDLGVFVSPVLFPAVPLGSARLRLCVTAAHSRETLEIALDAFRKLKE
jgi:glycine C-acetyltransferase